MAIGTLSIAIEAARNLLADSETFRTLVDATTRAEALASIYRDRLPIPADNRDTYTKAELDDYCPYALVGLPEGPNFRAYRAGAGVWSRSGTLWMAIVQSAPEGQTEAVADEGWQDTIGAILEELSDLSELPDNLMLTGIKLEMIGRPPVEEEGAKGNRQVAFALIDWGIGGEGGG